MFRTLSILELLRSQCNLAAAVQVSADVSSERAGLLRGEKYVSTLRNLGMEYLMDMTIAGRKLQAIPDTGSFDIVIPEAASLPCDEPSNCVLEEREIFLEYGSGKVWAYQAKADVSIGTLGSTGQSFLLGHKTTIENDGVMEVVAGIGPPAGGHELLVQLGVQYVSACLPLQGSGKLIWNDAPQGVSIPLAGKFHWGLHMTAATLEGPGGSHYVGCHGGCAAIMDTGTSLISAPTAVLKEIEQAMVKMGGDCDNIDKLASLKFQLGGHDFELPPETFVGYYETSYGETRCGILLLDSGDIGTAHGDLWILGMPFFSAYHTTFDLGSPGGMDKGNMRIHMAPTGGSCEPFSRTDEADRKLRKVDWNKVRVPGWLRSAKEEAAKGRNFTFAL